MFTQIAENGDGWVVLSHPHRYFLGAIRYNETEHVFEPSSRATFIFSAEALDEIASFLRQQNLARKSLGRPARPEGENSWGLREPSSARQNYPFF